MSEVIDNGKAYLKAAGQDIADANLAGKGELAFTGGSLVAHELGMEAFLAGVGLHVFAATGNPIEVGAAMGLASLTVETGLTLAVSHTVNRFNRLTEQLRVRHYAEDDSEAGKDTDEKDSTDVEIGALAKQSLGNKIREAADDATIAVTFGSPGRIIKEFGRDPDLSEKDRIKIGLKTSRRLGVVNFMIGATLTSATWAAEQTGHDATGFVENIATSPLTYLGIFGVFRAVNFMDRRAKRKASDAIAVESDKSDVQVAVTPEIPQIAFEAEPITE